MALSKKTTLFFATILVVIAIGILVYAYGIQQQRNEQAALSALGSVNTAATNVSGQVVPMRTSVAGCAETGDAQTATKGINSDQQKAQDPTITTKGRTLVYSHSLSHACCRKAIIKHKSTSTTIDITEYWQGKPCKCSCFSTLTASAPFIPPGIYDVTAYQQEFDPAQNAAQAESKVILQKQITIE